jgi:hypothetical protein
MFFIIQDFMMDDKILIMINENDKKINGKCPEKIFHIAVAGHRHIIADEALINSIRQILNRIVKENSCSEIFLYSALAEGSDQLMASISLNFQEIKLIVPLPLNIEDYLLDFNTQTGIVEFHNLLRMASEIIALPAVADHRLAYINLKDFLVQHCECFIAIWDGEYTMKKGGTGDVVNSALKTGKPVYWIFSENQNDRRSSTLKKSIKSGEIKVLGKT